MVSSMDTPFLTISEASEKTGRSLSTIRRLIKSISDNDAHADRAGIEPSPKEVTAYKKKGENFTWRIREDILLREFKGALKEQKKAVSEAKGDIMDILNRELELKNKQIEKQWEVIHALNDRLREGNILMGSLQKRLALPEPMEQETIVEAEQKEAVMASSGKASKKGLFGWMRK
jgi:hypothetical protein